MCVLATCGNPRFSVSTVEIDREGISYTVDTLAQLARQWPAAALFFIVGADVVDGFHKWKNMDGILGLCKIVVISRPGSAMAEGLAQKYGDSVVPLSIPEIDISSTKLRGLLARGETVRYLLPEGVADYIAKEGLYGGHLVHIKQNLRQALSAERFAHTLSVAGEAKKLGHHHGLSDAALEKLHLAALLHDCAKNYCDERPFAEIDELCRKNGLVLDDFFAQAPWLAHPFVGAIFAKLKYGVCDIEILDAIACHTFGRQNMTTIDKILRIADFIEPMRPPDDARRKARELAYADLDAANDFKDRLNAEKNAVLGRPVYKKNHTEENHGKK
jgi:nicotinate-nucleotide adenylyltransferase